MIVSKGLLYVHGGLDSRRDNSNLTSRKPNTQGMARRARRPAAGKRSSMDRLVIRGGRRIEGSVEIRGAKNAALPQIAAALLSSDRLELGNVPDVTDVDTMLALLGEFGVVGARGPGRTVTLDARQSRSAHAPYDMVRRMRAGILVLAPLLARFGV